MPAPSTQHSDILRKMLTRIAGTDKLGSWGDGGKSALESVRLEGMEVDVATPQEALAKVEQNEQHLLTGRERMQLEAIVEREGRPVVFFRGGKYDAIGSPWEHFNDAKVQGRLNAAAAAVGRVEAFTPSRLRTRHVGSGFLVGPRLLMTNRHVAEAFVTGAGDQPYIFRPGMSDRGTFDFGRELGFDPMTLSGTLHIIRVKMVHPYWDMALMELDGPTDAVQHLKLSTRDPAALAEEEKEIAVIGYPGPGSDTSAVAQQLETDLFEGIYGVKRLAPGFISGRADVGSYDHTVSAIVHSSSTLQGASGSPVIQASTGHVLALHFMGATLKANYSVPMHELARDPRVVDAGVVFEGAVPSTNAWDALWKKPFQPTPAKESRFPRPPRAVNPMTPPDAPAPPAAPGISVTSSTWTVPLTVGVSLGVPSLVTGATAVAEIAELESFQIPIIWDGLEERGGYDPAYLELGHGEHVPLPQLTEKGEKVVARQEDDSAELKYHHFSVVMHKKRRLALFTAANVDWRKASREPTGKKLTRAMLSGIPEGVMGQWVTDDRIPENQQLPDIFFTKDMGSFDKGHLVRRDDVAYGTSFDDVQMANGDTYYTTNCSPQVKSFNQAPYGEYNWGDLEGMVERNTKAEKVIIFSGPVLAQNDQLFPGRTETGPTKVQIPRRYWKIIVAMTDAGVKAFGFMPRQDLSNVPKPGLEFALPEDWLPYQVRIAEIEKCLYGLATLDWCKKHDAAPAA